MSEIDSILLAERDLGRPNTVVSLIADLRRLGLAAGQTVLVHSSLSRLGYVSGGAQAVIQAFQTVLTQAGTLVMPAHSGDLSDPAGWRNPPVPEAWWPILRRNMPAFDPDLTPTRGMGVIAETFRRAPGVQRSYHPDTSFAAWGRYAEAIVGEHTLEECLGEGSPLARLYDLDGWVLLLGVGHGNNTSLHLAEYRSDFGSKKYVSVGAPILVQSPDGQLAREWATFNDIALNDDDFEQLGADFDAVGGAALGKVGCADCHFMRQRALVDFAVTWMEKNRS